MKTIVRSSVPAVTRVASLRVMVGSMVVSLSGTCHCQDRPKPGNLSMTRSLVYDRRVPVATRPYHHGDLRRALIDAALETIERDGPAAVNLRELARRVGV